MGSPFFYPNSKLKRNIVGGISNIPKRYPTIINAQANKKIRVKVLVMSNFQEPEFSFFLFINKYILWRFIDIDSKRASAVISNQLTLYSFPYNLDFSYSLKNTMLPKFDQRGKETVFKLGNIERFNEIVYVCFYEQKNFYK